MARFSANLGFLWGELPLLERIDRAAAAGFQAIELHWPYETPAHAVRDACARHGLALLGINTPVGAALVGREAEFRRTFEATLQWCLQSGASAIHVMPGVILASERDAATATLLRNLQWAADQTAPHGLTVLLEAINQRDKPG